MYKVKQKQELIDFIKSSGVNVETYLEKVEQLTINPHSISKETGIPSLTEFYTNCGNKYCLLFDIDEDNHLILLVAIYHKAFIHKILKRKSNK